MMKNTGNRLLAAVVFAGFGMLVACREPASIAPPPQAPAIASVSPASATVGGVAFTLTVNGTNFVSGSIVQWNGSARTTTFVSSTQLTAAIAAADIAAAGMVQVTVANPAPGGVSAVATLTVNNPVPSLSSLSPASAAAGGVAFTLTVNGSAFVTGATVQWNGSARTTTFVSSTLLTAAISATDIAASGTANVTVLHPAPGGGASAAATFTINASNPVPALASLVPAGTVVGDPAFTLTVNGTNFMVSSTVRWNGSNRTTTFVTSTQLTAAIPASDVVTAGSSQITVVNPAPGGGASNALTFNIINPAPAITSISPTSATAGGAAFTLTVNGTNFVASSTVRWNGSNRTTTFVNSAQLTAAIPASDLTTAGTASVTVDTSPPGGGVSPAATFTTNLVGPNPVPSITAISPPGTMAGSAAFTLTVNGTDFVSSSTVQWNGANQTTTFVSSAQLTAAIAAADVAAIATANVTVVSPAPGGGASNTRTFGVGGMLALASVDFNGVALGFSSAQVSLAGNGRYVAFRATVDNVVPNDTNGMADVVLRDTCVGAPAGCTPSTILVAVNNAGQQANQDSFRPTVSADGRYVVFDSHASNLVAADNTPGFNDVFLRDTCIGALAPCTPSTTLIGVDSNGAPASPPGSDLGSISADGRYVAFRSDAGNLVAGDTNNQGDVFLRDTCNGAAAGCVPSTIRISVDSAGAQANNFSWKPALSADGRYVTFESTATNLAVGDPTTRPSNREDIFLRDTCNGAPAGCVPSTIRVSVSTAGAQGDNRSELPAISADGRFVTFTSTATNLVANDVNGSPDAFLRDTCIAAPAGCVPSTTRVSVNSAGVAQNAIVDSPFSSISGNGRFVVFSSFSGFYDPSDINSNQDVFVRDTCFGGPAGCSPSTIRLSVSPSGTGGTISDCRLTISFDGRYVAFLSLTIPLLPGDTNSFADVYLVRTPF